MDRKQEDNVIFNDTLNIIFNYGYMVSDILLRMILIERDETCCRHSGNYFFWLAARDLLYALFNRQNSTYHGFCLTSRVALDAMRNNSMGPPGGIDPTTPKYIVTFYNQYEGW